MHVLTAHTVRRHLGLGSRHRQSMDSQCTCWAPSTEHTQHTSFREPPRHGDGSNRRGCFARGACASSPQAARSFVHHSGRRAVPCFNDVSDFRPLQGSRAAGQQPSSAFLFQQPATQPAATAGHVGHIGHIARFSPTRRLDTVYLANEGLEQRRGTACPALAHPTKPRCSTSSAAFHSVFPLPRVPHHLRSRAKSDDDPVAKQLRTTPESSAARSTSPFTLHLQLTLSLRPAGP
jgi:hypothetical protein